MKRANWWSLVAGGLLIFLSLACLSQGGSGIYTSEVIDGDTIVITMRDNGKPFNPSNVKRPNLTADLSERQIGGLGLYLMRKLMDEVHYISSPITGNLLTMTKRRG